MRRHFGNKILSQEEEVLNPDLPPAEAAAEDVVVAKAGQELAEAVVEQNDSEVEGEARVEELAEGGEIVEALESLALLVGDAAKGQGFSRDAAAATQLQYDFYRRRLGDTGPSKMPSLESFGATSSRIRGTVASLEEIGELARRAWKAIVEKVKAAFKWMRDHFLKIFGSAEKLVKRADALKAKADNLKGSIKEKSFENEALVKKLYVGTAAPTAAGAVKAAQDFSETVSGFVTHATGLAGKLTAAAETGLKDGETFKVDGIDAPTSFTKGNAPANRKSTAGEGVRVVGSDQLPGGKVIVAVVPAPGLVGEAAMNALSNTRAVIDAVEGAKAPTNAKLETLDRGMLTGVAEQISKLGTALVQSRSATDEAGKKRDALERQLDAFARGFEKAEGETGEGKKKDAAAAKRLVTKLPTIVDFGATRVFAEGIATGNAFLDWVQLSMKQFAEQ